MEDSALRGTFATGVGGLTTGELLSSSLAAYETLSECVTRRGARIRRATVVAPDAAAFDVDLDVGEERSRELRDPGDEETRNQCTEARTWCGATVAGHGVSGSRSVKPKQPW